MYSNWYELFNKTGPHSGRIFDTTVKVPEYHISHHAVIKETSTSTKLRFVFDASMKTSNGVSLSDLLLVGPSWIYFLCYYVFVSDIKQMCRQM